MLCTFKRRWNSSNGHHFSVFPNMGMTLLSWLYTARTNILEVVPDDDDDDDDADDGADDGADANSRVK